MKIEKPPVCGWVLVQMASVGVAVVAVVAGLYGSYFFNLSAGAAIVLASSACFLLAGFVRTARGLVVAGA